MDVTTAPQSIADLRRRAGLTQQELANRAGIARVSISRYEIGAVVPGVRKLQAIARALGVSMDAISLPERSHVA